MRCKIVTVTGRQCKNNCNNNHGKCHIHSDDCTICLRNLACHDDVCQLRCGHTFHSDCLYRWNYQDCRCPCCRSAVLTPRRIEIYHTGCYDTYIINKSNIHTYVSTVMLEICKTNKVRMDWVDGKIIVYDVLSERVIDNLDANIFIH